MIMPPPPMQGPLQGGGMPPQMDPSQAQGGMQGLLGGGAPPMQGPDPVDQNAAIMRVLMMLDQQVDALAIEFPQAAEAARQIKDGLKQMLVAIVSVQPGLDSAPAPRAI